jgi:hypothetical protein
MSEEELAALIDQAVTEAILATEQYSTATTDATADSTVTPEEVQTIEVYVAGAEEAIALAEELIYIYYDLYGAMATETVAAIEEINQSLQYIAEYAVVMTATLEEMNSTLEQGLELAEETITQLETVAETAAENLGSIEEQVQTWAAIREAQIDSLPLDVQPNQIATDPQGAVQSAFDFIGAGHQALADGAISPEELSTLAQLGANASASLNAQENAQFQQIAGSVNNITGQIANGNLPQAQEALSQLGVDTALAVQPNQVAGDFQGAIQAAFSFADAGNQALADGNISVGELANLAQLGANASASLNAHGGPQLQQLSGSINDITGQVARGDVPQAQDTLNRFGNSLGSMPEVQKLSLPDVEKPAPPAIEKPSLPEIEKPSRRS